MEAKYGLFTKFDLTEEETARALMVDETTVGLIQNERARIAESLTGIVFKGTLELPDKEAIRSYIHLQGSLDFATWLITCIEDQKFKQYEAQQIAEAQKAAQPQPNLG